MYMYIIEIQTRTPKFANNKCREFDQSEPRCSIKFCVYFHPVGYIVHTTGMYNAGNY